MDSKLFVLVGQELLFVLHFLFFFLILDQTSADEICFFSILLLIDKVIFENIQEVYE